jgi:predicted dehydrogenase
MALRIGIVGAGAMAEYHAKRLGGLPGLSIAAVCDHLPSRALSFAERFGIPSRFTEPQAMCASGEIDALSVASIDGSHAAPAIAALELGLPVFCEKPMARRLGEALAMEEAARRTKVPALVNFSKRNGGLLGLASSIAASGRVGAPMRLELRYLQSWLLQSSWGDWRSTPRWRWRLLESQSTYGVIGDLGGHLFDAALVLAGAGRGAEPEVLSCSAQRFVPGSGDDLGGEGAFESFEAELALGPLSVSLRAGWRAEGHPDDFSATIFCEDGRIEVSPGRSRSSVLVVDGEGKSLEVEAGPVPSTYELFARLAEERNLPDPDRDPDFSRGLAVQKAIEACSALAGTGSE